MVAGPTCYVSNEMVGLDPPYRSLIRDEQDARVWYEREKELDQAKAPR